MKLEELEITEIIDTLGMPNSTYYRYKYKIYKEAKKLWNQVCTESLEYRALLIKKSFEAPLPDLFSDVFEV